MSNDLRENENNVPQSRVHDLDNMCITLKRQKGEDEFDQCQQCEDLLMVIKMQKKGKDQNTEVSLKDSKIQRLSYGIPGTAHPFGKKEKPVQSNDKDNAEKKNSERTEVPEFFC